MAPVASSSSSSPAATASSSSSRLTWTTALVLLEAASVTGSVAPSAAAFVSSHRSQLERPHEPFSRKATNSASVAGGALVPAAQANSNSAERKLLVQAVADRFDLDDQQAQGAVEAALRGSSAAGDKGKGKEPATAGSTQLSPDEWDRATAWVFEERMAVIGVVALLLRTYDDESHPCYELASELLPSILTDSFCPTLLSAFATRTSQSLPDAVRASPSHALFWTRQLVCEQKALLELVFLAFYSPRPARGADLVRVLETIRTTEWGQRQHLFGYFDAETQSVVSEIAHLLTILAIEAMNLENAMELEYPIGAPGEQGVDKESIFAPENLVRINEQVEHVVRLDGERSSPVLLGWAFILSKVTTSLLERGVPEAYHTFAEQSLRVDVPVSGSSARSPRRGMTTQPLFQLYAAHALSPSSALFPVLIAMLHSTLLGSSAATGTADPNAVGYLSVLRGLVTSLPNLVRLSFLSPPQLEALYEVFAALYGSPSAALLCAQFWEDQAVVASAAASTTTAASHEPDLEASLLLLNRTAQSSGEAEIVELARSRFPVQFGGLTKLVRALCTGVSGLLPPDHLVNGGSTGIDNETSSDDELLAAKCAQTIFAYLATLPTLTHIVPSGPGVVPLPYEAAAYPDPDTGYAFRVVRPIGVSRSVAIPTGTQGRLVSANGSKPIVVAWDVEWSAWRLFADVLEDYAGLGRAGSNKRVRADVFGSKEAVTDALPMEWDSEEEHERDVTAVLDILRVTLRNDHALAPVLVDHLATAPGHKAGGAGTSAPRYDLVEVLFRILERSLAPNTSRPTSTELVSSLIGLIAALLPSFPGIVWTFLRGSTLLFPSQRVTSAYGRSAASYTAAASSPLLQAEKLSGRYPVTLALLSLVHGLVLEDQIASCVSSPEYREVKRGVLVRALKWVRDDVWPVFGSWRFATLADKYALARSCVQLYRLVLEYAPVGPAAKTQDPVVQVVVDSFLGAKATVAQLAPALSTLSSGPEGIILLRKAGRYADAQALEDLVDSALGLVLDLLRLRRRTKSKSISLLEKLCLTPAGTASYSTSASPSTFGFTAVLSGQEPTRRPELLESLTKFVVAPLDTRLAVQAAQIVTLLCLASAGTDDLTAGVRAPTSLATLLGGSDGVESIVKALLSIAEDHLVAPELQVAVWDLISSIVDSQPGLAMLFVTGRAYPFSTETDILLSDAGDKDKSKELTPAETSARELAKSLAPKAPQPLPRTAVGVALETIGTWSDAWETQPAVLAAVLRFFDFVWQHLVDYGTALDDLRSKAPTWEAFVKIAFASTGSEPAAEGAVVAHCHRTIARAHAARIVALDIQAAASKPKPEDAVSVKALFAALSDAKRTTSLLSSVIATSCAPALHSGTFDLVNSAFPQLDLDSLRNPAATHALDEARDFGVGYLFALPLVRRRLDGYMADPDVMAGQETLDDAVRQIVKLNLNFSLLEAQILDTRSWRQLLETVAPLARSRKEVADASIDGISLIASEIAEESRGGEVMQTVQAERLSILLVLVRNLAAGSADKVKVAVVDLVASLAAAFASETLEPLESLARRSSIAVHATLLRTTFFAVQLVTKHFDSASPAAEERTKLSTAIESILRDVLTATRDLLVLSRASKDVALEQDLALATAVLAQLLRSPFLPPAPVWLAQMHSLDLLRCAFEVLVHMDVGADGRPLYAQHVLDLCLALATTSPRAAEQLALDGVMTALTNNALTAAAEAGAISLVSPTEATRTVQHELWTAMLRLVVALISALGESTRFVEQDVTGFVRLYGQQFVRALEWNSDAPITLAGLKELAAVVSIMHGVARASSAASHAAAGTAASVSASPVMAVARVFVEQSLHLLQHVVYALLHPNHLAALIEGLSAEERARLDKETSTIVDVEKRPIAALVTGKVLQLARDIVEALVAYGDAWATLVKDPVEWRTDRACVALTATVTSSEPASLGTLFDLISYSLDTLRSPPSPAAPSGCYSSSPSASGESAAIDLAATCAETLESTLVFAVSQLLLHSAVLSSGSSSSLHEAQQMETEGGGAGQQQPSLGEKQRSLLELASETSELLDKAASGSGAGGASRKRLIEVLKARLRLWCAAGGTGGGGGGTKSGAGGGGGGEA
ncbi:hypothetical protein JCM10908_005252 [Rhodotorula pacifica]|uniref:uncharacterized protein n=1 Tax=Rhodotorula pacifica TaxID=1495444 RepID=UPI0031743BDD